MLIKTQDGRIGEFVLIETPTQLNGQWYITGFTVGHDSYAENYCDHPVRQVSHAVTLGIYSNYADAEFAMNFIYSQLATGVPIVNMPS